MSSLHNLVICRTGISPRYIADFCSGVGDARSRLRWAMYRSAQRYCIFALFCAGNQQKMHSGRLLPEVISKLGNHAASDRSIIRISQLRLLPSFHTSRSGDFRSEIQSYLRCDRILEFRGYAECPVCLSTR